MGALPDTLVRPKSGRPRTTVRSGSGAGSRPGTATRAAEAVLEVSLALSGAVLTGDAAEADLRAANRKLREAIAAAMESQSAFRNEALDAALNGLGRTESSTGERE